MKYNIITTQPNIYDSFLTTGLVARGINKKIIDIKINNLHDYATDKRKSIDDTPYGGGAGMIIRVDVMAKAIKCLKAKLKTRKACLKAKVILLTPQGVKFTQNDAVRLANNSNEKEIILIAGRFEGYDERIRDLVDEEISIGDYVLTSGDLPAMVLIDSISRQIPKFIEKEASIVEESFSENLLEYPQYTRPKDFDGKKVPEVLISGDHKKIEKYRQQESIEKTKKRRPDLS